MRNRGGLAILAFGIAACGQVDRCLDGGGRWNAESSACSLVAGPIETPALAIEAGKRTLAFAYGPAILEQEPFVAELADDVWHVYGTHARGSFGGVAHVWIALGDGSVEKIVRGD